MRDASIGQCESCGREFEYYLVHNGFNESSYAYCDTCGRTALLSHWDARFPGLVEGLLPGTIRPEVEERLRRCECGGRFKAGSKPRCPECRHEISADAASGWIEKNAPGSASGWRWQRNWQDTYAIVIEGRIQTDNFK